MYTKFNKSTHFERFFLSRIVVKYSLYSNFKTIKKFNSYKSLIMKRNYYC